MSLFAGNAARTGSPSRNVDFIFAATFMVAA